MADLDSNRAYLTILLSTGRQRNPMTLPAAKEVPSSTNAYEKLLIPPPEPHSMWMSGSVCACVCVLSCLFTTHPETIQSTVGHALVVLYSLTLKSRKWLNLIIPSHQTAYSRSTTVQSLAYTETN